MYHFTSCAIDWSGERWNLTNMADHTQLSSPDRLEAKQAIVQDMSTTVRRLEQQLQECHLRVEELQSRVGASATAVQDFQQQAQESNRRAEDAEERVHHTERSLAEMRQTLRQYEDRLENYSTHWVISKEEIELTGPELGVGGGGLQLLWPSSEESKLL